ncbi:CBS domain-containing protein [Prosthecobacter sp.]|uniref:CBS domain-containing protein n=1 Tax=Prosthecobacter sp. TaxID=1965333 RepID=UPI0037837E85
MKLKRTNMEDKMKSEMKPAEETPLKEIAETKADVLHPEDSVETAGERMRNHDASKWPVVQGSKLVGMVTQENPDWKIGGRGHDPKSWKVGQIMSQAVAFCYEDEDCASAERLMNERGLDYLPVVDREMRIIGIFSRQQIKAGVQAADKEINEGND